MKTTCSPLTGLCSQGGDDSDCADADTCTLDTCDVESGECTNDFVDGCGENHPCKAAETPGSNDEAVNQCVCDVFPECCNTAWEPFCPFIAQDFCGVSCDCSTFDVEDLACDEDADCQFCDPDQNACNGTYTCQDSVCAQLPAFDNECDDGDPCTENGCSLETMECENPIIEGCGENHPCQSAGTPGSNDDAIEACVCALDPFCCETAWDGACVSQVGECGLTCDCAEAPEAELECEVDADCGYCDPDGTVCNGGWTCQDGQCGVSEPIDCGDPDNVGCLVLKCLPELGACDYAPVEALCEDGDACTTDTCDAETGDCASDLFADECGFTSPCLPVPTPASNDPAINACVCGVSPGCCTEEWDEQCVELALFQCGLTCNCIQSPPACESDEDCATCDDADLCNGQWICGGETCELLEPIKCEPDGNAGCLLPVCDPATGDCDYAEAVDKCDDGDPCTSETCSDAGICGYENVEECAEDGGGDIPFPEPFPIPPPQP